MFDETHAGTPDACGGTFAHDTAEAFGFVGWRDGTPGTVTVSDDCGGFAVQGSTDHFWEVLDNGNATCTVTFHATSLQGAGSVAMASFNILAQ